MAGCSVKKKKEAEGQLYLLLLNPLF